MVSIDEKSAKNLVTLPLLAAQYSGYNSDHAGPELPECCIWSQLDFCIRETA